MGQENHPGTSAAQSCPVGDLFDLEIVRHTRNEDALTDSTTALARLTTKDLSFSISKHGVNEACSFFFPLDLWHCDLCGLGRNVVAHVAFLINVVGARMRVAMIGCHERQINCQVDVCCGSMWHTAQIVQDGRSGISSFAQCQMFDIHSQELAATFLQLVQIKHPF